MTLGDLRNRFRPAPDTTEYAVPPIRVFIGVDPASLEPNADTTVFFCSGCQTAMYTAKETMDHRCRG